MDFLESNIDPLPNVAPSNTYSIVDFFFKKVILFVRHAPNFHLDLLWKIQFLKNFKITVETSLIAHSIANFILKKIRTVFFGGGDYTHLFISTQLGSNPLI